MRSYGQFCPVAQSLEVIGERWTLLIVRELISGSTRFNDLMRGLPLISRTLLSQRLKTLQEHGIVERNERGGVAHYELTPAGRELEGLVVGLGTWGQRWVKRKLTREERDTRLLMWDVQRSLDLDALPTEDVTVQFWFRDAPAAISRYWMRVEQATPELCLKNPGFDVDLKVESKIEPMIDVWMGHRDIRQAIRAGDIELTGNKALQKAFPSWLKLSHFAPMSTGPRDP